MTNFVTKNGLMKLKLQHRALVDELRESISKMGKSASIDNDLRENPEFMQLRTKATYELPKKISELNDILKNHIFIETTDIIMSGRPEIVSPGCKITLSDKNGQKREVTILGIGESDPEIGIVSYLTPLAQSLIDLEVGDEIKIPLQGKMIVYEIKDISVSPLLQADKNF